MILVRIKPIDSTMYNIILNKLAILSILFKSYTKLMSFNC